MPPVGELDGARTSRGRKIMIRCGRKWRSRWGDYFWSRRNMTDWSQAWPHYQNALDWWAGTADIELARARYLKIVWTCAHPSQFGPRNFITA